MNGWSTFAIGGSVWRTFVQFWQWQDISTMNLEDICPPNGGGCVGGCVQLFAHNN